MSEEYWTLDIERPGDAIFYGKLKSLADHSFSLTFDESENLILETYDIRSSNLLHKTTFHYNENSLGDRLILKDCHHDPSDAEKMTDLAAPSSSWSLNDPEQQGFALVGISSKNYYSSVNR